MFTSTTQYDPFGQSVNSATFGTSGTPNNASGLGMGWATNPSRKTESMFSLAVMQMGARVYIPTLGRFAQTDPVDGGTPNAYTYVLDPVNFADYSGQWGFHMPKWVKTVAKIVVAIVVVAVVAVVAVAALPEEVVAAIGAGAVAAARAVAAGASWAANRGSSIVSGAAKAVSAGSKGTNAASTAVRAMPRADPGRITAVGSKAAPLVNRAESGLLGNTPTTIAGRWYSGHALNGMQNTGIYPSVVENTVKFGKLVESSRADTYKFYDAENDISVILNASGGVVTTFYGK